MNSSIARFAVVAITVAIATTAFASTSDQIADRVLGQIGFSQNTLNFGGLGALDGPSGAAVDAQGHLYVVDQGNNRVLGFASAASFLNGAVDYIRVLEYLNPTAAGGGTPGTPGSPGDTTADVVYGQQGDFTSGACNGNDFSTIVSAATLCQPVGVAVDPSGDVYIADTENHRVLAFTFKSSP